MSTKRREFIKMATMAGLGIASANALYAQQENDEKNFRELPKRIEGYQKNHRQVFNMSGYRITSYNVCYTKLLRSFFMLSKAIIITMYAITDM